jgi:transposase-like protein
VWRETADELRGRCAKLTEMIEVAERDVLSFMAILKQHWSQITSTNPTYQVNRRSIGVLGCRVTFPPTGPPPAWPARR